MSIWAEVSPILSNSFTLPFNDDIGGYDLRKGKGRAKTNPKPKPSKQASDKEEAVSADEQEAGNPMGKGEFNVVK